VDQTGKNKKGKKWTEAKKRPKETEPQNTSTNVKRRMETKKELKIESKIRCKII